MLRMFEILEAVNVVRFEAFTAFIFKALDCVTAVGTLSLFELSVTITKFWVSIVFDLVMILIIAVKY